VGQVNDQIAFAQVEKRVDHLPESSPRQTAQLATVEQLAGGEDKYIRRTRLRLAFATSFVLRTETLERPIG
jgi:hypothetical protein